MNEDGIVLACRASEIVCANRIHGEGAVRVSFAIVYAMVSSRINDALGAQLGDAVRESLLILYIQLLVRARDHVMTYQPPAKITRELAGSS